MKPWGCSTVQVQAKILLRAEGLGELPGRQSLVRDVFPQWDPIFWFMMFSFLHFLWDPVASTLHKAWRCLGKCQKPAEGELQVRKFGGGRDGKAWRRSQEQSSTALFLLGASSNPASSHSADKPPRTLSNAQSKGQPEGEAAVGDETQGCELITCEKNGWEG